MKTHSEKFLKKRKFLLVLPLLALPFITLAFWAMGGGKGTNKSTQHETAGLNKALPDARLASGQVDKMSLYNQAAKDSLLLAEQRRSDPYGKRDSLPAAGYQDPYSTYPLQQMGSSYGGYGTNSPMSRYGDPNELKVNNKLAELERAMNESANSSPYEKSNGFSGSPDFSQLQQALNRGANENSGTDPEMAQLNSMLEKLQEIQNPAIAQQKLREQSQKNRGRVYPVSKIQQSTDTDLLTAGNEVTAQGKNRITENAFYNIEAPLSSEDTIMQTAITAAIDQTQTIVSGTSLKMRLSEDVFIGGMLIPKGTAVSGLCNLENERLTIQVTAIRYNKNVFPIALSVYDLDAIEGIRIPGALGRDAAKEGADRAIQSVQMMSLDPSFGAQAAGAGVEAAKGLFSKKARLIRVTVKAGYPVLLIDTKAKQGY